MIVFSPICFYVFYPVQINAQDYSHSSTQQSVKLSKSPQQFFSLFLQMFQDQLRNKLKSKKAWTPEEDKILLKLRSQGKNWGQISDFIQDSNAEKCKRRYLRLRSTRKRWPEEIENQIKWLCEQKKFSWSEVALYINKKFSGQRLNSKQVKERYLFYLKEGISTEKWQIEEDLKLITQVYANGKYWKNIAEKFPNRTQLQLKNRFYGTLKFIQNKVLQKLNNYKRDQALQQDLS